MRARLPAELDLKSSQSLFTRLQPTPTRSHSHRDSLNHMFTFSWKKNGLNFYTSSLEGNKVKIHKGAIHLLAPSI